ncbi:LysM peptidoglycan-binding domain-containing protein [Kitasatospora sp. NBC_00240]|uniref:CIS tube protein n=1 Tax=Kitasatospora sp. NBC_00240 TaxID=2903567 RepID=UPI00224CC145|nr:LysM peptidoglycan-binding domain-containing protein [Kitasatospora sp. NBC_00240]MCX5213551.1 LysM peptidoglycan-binding domain-containing protein [Kitasatospora sp. NBC_00240]
MQTTPSKATLTAYEPPPKPGAPPGGRLGPEIRFQFNPNTLSLSKGAQWRQNLIRGGEETGVPEFMGAQPRQLTVELFLDATATRDDSVAKSVETLLGWCAPTPASIAAKAPSAPRVMFAWGSFESVKFFGYLGNVSATYSLFDPSGRPLRATCQVQVTESGEPTPGQNPTSGALNARRVHRLVAGDSLELLAYQEYGDATAWRRIAEANGIDDPMRLRPGAELLVPAAAESRAG